jgi:hypothetical protein
VVLRRPADPVARFSGFGVRERYAKRTPTLRRYMKVQCNPGSRKTGILAVGLRQPQAEP